MEDRYSNDNQSKSYSHLLPGGLRIYHWVPVRRNRRAEATMPSEPASPGIADFRATDCRAKWRSKGQSQ
jgi:hypothetical protein